MSSFKVQTQRMFLSERNLKNIQVLPKVQLISEWLFDVFHNVIILTKLFSTLHCQTLVFLQCRLELWSFPAILPWTLKGTILRLSFFFRFLKNSDDVDCFFCFLFFYNFALTFRNKILDVLKKRTFDFGTNFGFLAISGFFF